MTEHKHSHDDGCTCGCCSHDDLEGAELLDEDFLDLRPVNDRQFACSGEDLEALLNYDLAEIDADALFNRLGLTPHAVEICGAPYVTFDEIDPEGYYLVTLTEGADATEFSTQELVAFESISETCFNELQAEEDDWPCDGDCDKCLQDCIGKTPPLA